ncbi:MFS transporter [Coraliomargarita sp. SDUM461004]|uniref:MFS transporter n=1 Tax=Thalassobacterium sedimentorum TaxID=3041258 RepID=A0ABU1AEZ5_9BACT|nr:MFS transporter [Coraliomargarita sp. SDUM461004]MDQ8193244.1 MFS transporter [Coraliomargarita sp. SDUM461004]
MSDFSKTTTKFWHPDFPLRPKRWPFFYGWVIVVFATLGISVSMPGQTIGVSVFTARLADALHLSTMQLSVTYMLGTLLSAAWLPAGGRFFDRCGARRSLVYSVAALGFVLLGLSFVEFFSSWLSRLPLLGLRPWLAPCVVLVVGFALLRFTGQGMVTLSSRAMLGKWFNRRRGAVTAWSGAVVSFMFSGAPMGFEYLIRAFGWQGAWQVMGLGLLGVLSILFWIFARDNPEECGLQMDGNFVGKVQRENLDSLIYRDYTLSEARGTFSFWVFTLMFGLNSLVITAYAFHIIAIGAELGVSTNYILGLFMPSAVVGVISGFAIAWLTDQAFVRIKYLLCVMAISAMLGYIALAMGAYPSISWLHILGLGVAGGCFGGLSSIVYPRFFGRAHLGAISGLFMTVIVVASAVGPFLFSLAELFLGAYRAGFGFAAIVSGVIAVAALRADNPQRREAVSHVNGTSGS